MDGMTALLQVDPNKVGPGLLAFVVVVLLGIATVLLIRSMRNQMRKVPPSFDHDQATHEQQPLGQADPPPNRQS
jgi:hypothetical protein